jgi:SAM-dependent methyltransferase
MSDLAFTNADTKPWHAFPHVLQYVLKLAGNGQRILDVGPGYAPFPLATHVVDFRTVDLPDVVSVSMNLRMARLPFEDRFFDFVYCRHTIEDMDDPSLLLEEMKRVGKRGYIETPSPLSELCRGIDGNSPPWRGYVHHRHFVWVENDTLCLLPKLPHCEFLSLNDAKIVSLLRRRPELANAYLYWEGDFKVRFVSDENLVKFHLRESIPSYQELVVAAADRGIISSLRFLERMGHDTVS